jgi:hypothetical protein
MKLLNFLEVVKAQAKSVRSGYLFASSPPGNTIAAYISTSTRPPHAYHLVERHCYTLPDNCRTLTFVVSGRFGLAFLAKIRP